MGIELINLGNRTITLDDCAAFRPGLHQRRKQQRTGDAGSHEATLKHEGGKGLKFIRPNEARHCGDAILRGRVLAPASSSVTFSHRVAS